MVVVVLGADLVAERRKASQWWLCAEPGGGGESIGQGQCRVPSSPVGVTWHLISRAIPTSTVALHILRKHFPSALPVVPLTIRARPWGA